VWGASALEVADVDTFGSPHPDPPGQRLMHVPEQRSTRPVPADHRKQLLGADFGSAGLHVIEQLRHRGWDVAA
jgi:hypothetical protein